MLREEFERQVLEDLSELKTNMKALIGNGQPGRVGKLETAVSMHDKHINRLIGALILINLLFSFALMYIKSRL